jgi:hypothetical protein
VSGCRILAAVVAFSFGSKLAKSLDKFQTSETLNELKQYRFQMGVDTGQDR